MAQQANKAASTQIEVVFVEVDALYDLPGRRLVGSPDSPKVAIHNDLRDPLYVDYYGMPQFVDPMGDKVDGPTNDVPGMYGGVRVSGYGPFWRSFSRKRTSPIDKKYVYVFSADSPTGGNLALEHELYFDKGQVQLVNLQTTAGSDVRKPGKIKYPSVWLDLVRVRGGKATSPAYFALLAPFQIPWQRLQDILADGSVAPRSSRLGDAFWTDGFTGGDPSTAKTFHELFKGGKPDTLGLVCYLVDPLKEALVRLEPFQKNLDAWLDKQMAMASDDQYVFAKRVDLFSSAYSLQATVNPKLPSYLRDAEKDLCKLRVATEDGCENLLRWTGYQHQHDRVGNADICYRDGHGKEYQPTAAQSYPTAWCNPFSDAVRDYLGADADTAKLVQQVTLAVQARLAETTAGLTWMTSVFDDLVAQSFPVATAGAEMLFDSKRKGTAAPTELWAYLFKHWGPIWTKKYRREATSNVKSWLKATHGVDVATLSATEFKREWRAMKRGRKNLDLLWIDSNKTQLGKLSSTAAKHVMVGFQVFNLAMSVSALEEEPDGWHALGLIGSIADFYADAVKLSEKLEEAKVTFKYAGAVKVLKVAPFVSVISSTIDFVLAGKSALEAKTGGERVGHSMRALGSVLTIISASGDVLVGTGEATSETGWGVGILVAGLALESAGSLLVADVAPAAVFLRHCEWGSGGGGLDRTLERFSEGDFYGYTGKFASLPGDRDAQVRILNELIYDFDPKLELENEHSVLIAKSLILRTGTPGEEKKNPLNPGSKWAIDLSIDHLDGQPPDTWSFRPDGMVDDLDASMNRPLIVKAFSKRKEADPHSQASGRIVVTGTAKLDPFGTGRYFIERKINESFGLGWLAR